jgi:UPF0755 protein
VRKQYTYLAAGLLAVLLVIGGAVFAFSRLFSSPQKTVSVASVPVAASSSNNAAASSSHPIHPSTSGSISILPTAPLPVGTARFIVPLTASTTDDVAQLLLAQNFITSTTDFDAAYAGLGASVAPGAYKLSASMTAPQIAATLHGMPYMKWVVVPEGLRKEEIAVLLGTTLGWTSAQETAWENAYKQINADDIEGVYFPDTYLIPVAETPTTVATRIIDQFNQSFLPYSTDFTAQNIKWTTGLNLASIVQREAADDADMPLIAGILWNRLTQNIALDVDATLQYARGNTGNGWWAPVTAADKAIDSPYNTYKYKGLPPHPISNPGLAAIEAVLQPASTTCIYYIHDKNRVTHCADTYAKQQANIQMYLINQ